MELAVGKVIRTLGAGAVLAGCFRPLRGRSSSGSREFGRVAIVTAASNISSLPWILSRFQSSLSNPFLKS